MDQNSSGEASEDKVLSVRNLVIKYKTYQKDVVALSNVSLDVPKSTVIAIVGESGCGKSTLGYSIIGLLQKPPAEVGGGEIFFQGKIF